MRPLQSGRPNAKEERLHRLTVATRRHAFAAAVFVLLAASCARDEPQATTAPTGSPVPVATPNESATPGPAIASLERWADFETPIALHAPEGDEAWYVVQRTGKVWRYDGSDRKEIIDVSDEVQTEAEQGLYDFVLSPDRRYAYIHFTGDEKPYGDSHVREYRWTGSDVEGEGREVLVVEDPYPHHNGGQMQFGPDDLLYIAIGDGGTKELAQEPDNGDPHGYGYKTNDLLGGILRIDPRPDDDGQEYTIPEDNPFVDSGGRGEVWAYGLRNPWRFSFDRDTGDLWVPDVGHRFWEEINVQRAGSKGGENYGWSRLEGPQKYKGDPPRDHVLPVYAYPHRGGPCAIIGGYVYRGTKIPDLKGWYVFGDFCTGTLQAIRVTGKGRASHRYLGINVERLVSLAEDRDGELFALSYDKGIFRIVPK